MAGEDGWHGASATVWIAVMMMIVGSILMAIGLIEWVWLMFWIGTGVLVIGGVVAAFAGIMNAVTEFGPPSSGLSQRREDAAETA
jgi:hypothetical protein